jgi:hypothetical protein
MNRNATLRFRRATALLALAWALLAFSFAAVERLTARPELVPPLVIGGLATQPWRISALSFEARAKGVAPGDHLLAIDGEIVERAFGERTRFRAGIPNEYRIRKEGSDREVEYSLPPVTAKSLVPRSLSLVLLLLPLITSPILDILRQLGQRVQPLHFDALQLPAIFLHPYKFR